MEMKVEFSHTDKFPDAPAEGACRSVMHMSGASRKRVRIQRALSGIKIED